MTFTAVRKFSSVEFLEETALTIWHYKVKKNEHVKHLERRTSQYQINIYEHRYFHFLCGHFFFNLVNYV